MQDAKNIRFHISSKVISGSFTLTCSSYLTYEIEEAIDDFITSHSNKKNRDNLSIQKINNGYEINVNAFMAICQIIFRTLKNYS